MSRSNHRGVKLSTLLWLYLWFVALCAAPQVAHVLHEARAAETATLKDS